MTYTSLFAAYNAAHLRPYWINWFSGMDFNSTELHSMQSITWFKYIQCALIIVLLHTTNSYELGSG